MSTERLAWAALSIVTLILSVAIHEFAHAFAAHKLGDDLPEQQGRLTLNPLAHADPFGTFLVPVVGALLGGIVFGWGRPVETIPSRYTRKVSMRGGEAIVAFAGPFSNLLLGLLCSLLLVLFRELADGGLDLPELLRSAAARTFLANMAVLNFALFVLNMIPVPPLDGSKIAAWLFGQKADEALDWLASVQFIAMMVIVFACGKGIGWAASTAFYAIVGPYF